MEEQEREWRLRWARYFDARADKSEANARSALGGTTTVVRDEWLAKAAAERECAFLLRSKWSLEELEAKVSLL